MSTKIKIPPNWQQVKLGDIVDFWNGKGHEKNIVDYGKYIVVNSKFVSSDGKIKKYSDQSFSPLSKGDVTMVMSDVPNGRAIAKCYLIEEDEKYTLNQRIGGFRSKKVLSSFLTSLLNRNKYFLSFDDGVNQTNLRKDDILECSLRVPPIPEQHRIVTILETWDKTIDLLTKKIKLKKEVKKGLMQKLLTGDVRLPGFSVKWKNVKIKDICDIKKGQGLSKDKLHDKGKYGCILYGQLYTKYSEIIKNIVSKTDIEEGVRSVTGDILIPASTTTNALDLAIASCLEEDNILLGGDINILRAKKKYNSKFLAYYLTHTKRHKLARLAQGITIVHLYGKDFKKLEIELPTTEEQNTIVNILINAQNEIALLQQKLNELKKQKKYLLNKLVTGEIRTSENMKIVKYKI